MLDINDVYEVDSVSDCCGESVYINGICSSCNDHCSVWEFNEEEEEEKTMFKKIRTTKIDTGGGVELAVVFDEDKVIIIGNGYVTVWKELKDFYKSLNGDDIQPLKQWEV
jgi:hypothetical protein